MAGHSKWANIKHRKAAQDAKRGKAFTKLIRELVVAAKHGGPAPEDNPRLRAAVDKALGANMTRDTIDRAIARGAGNNDADDMEEITYEGYAPGGIAVLRAIFSVLDVDSMRVASGALREGLLYDLVGRMQHEDVREQSVKALARRCGVPRSRSTTSSRKRNHPRRSPLISTTTKTTTTKKLMIILIQTHMKNQAITMIQMITKIMTTTMTNQTSEKIMTDIVKCLKQSEMNFKQCMIK